MNQIVLIIVIRERQHNGNCVVGTADLIELVGNIFFWRIFCILYIGYRSIKCRTGARLMKKREILVKG